MWMAGLGLGWPALEDVSEGGQCQLQCGKTHRKKDRSVGFETLGVFQSSVLGCYSACFEHLFVLCSRTKDAFKLYSSPLFRVQGKPSAFTASLPARSQGWICQCRFELRSALFRPGAVFLLLLYTLERGKLESGSGNRQ